MCSQLITRCQQSPHPDDSGVHWSTSSGLASNWLVFMSLQFYSEHTRQQILQDFLIHLSSVAGWSGHPNLS